MAGLPREQVVKVRADLDNAVVVRPGDKLVVAIARQLSIQQAEMIKSRFATKLPGVEIVLVDQCSGLAVYRDEPQPFRKLSRLLSDDEVQALRERGVIDDEGKSAGDKIAEYFAEHA